MLFTVSKPLRVGSLDIKPGDLIHVFPTKNEKLKLSFNGKYYISPPYILKYLREIEFPCVDTLCSWYSSPTCISPTGHIVEHTGTGPDGFHSWFVYFAML